MCVYVCVCRDTLKSAGRGTRVRKVDPQRVCGTHKHTHTHKEIYTLASGNIRVELSRADILTKATRTYFGTELTHTHTHTENI